LLIKRKTLALATFLLAMIMAVGAYSAAVAPKTSTQEVSEGLTCQCGCGLTVANCNHPQCEFAVPVRTQIDKMIANGMTRPQIVAWFRTTYGEKVLSAPTTEGFNLVAWIMPFAVLIAGGVGIVFAFGRWRSSTPVAPSAPAPTDPELKQRLERELRERL
jgi:cytochrome c-type biogenesis protein CcmH/NrfF